MTLSEAQNLVDDWIQEKGVRYFDELTNFTILVEEVGELARIFAREYGEQSYKASDKKNTLENEMGDIFWVLLAMANQTGIKLEEALKKNLDKKNTRDSTRHIDNPKLNS
ncbi:MAG: nucleotide pyrophosphohydrolase [Bacteroidota bacterium]